MQEPAQDFTAREEEISQPDVPPEQSRPNLQVFEGGAAKPPSPAVPEIVEPAKGSTLLSRSVDTMTPGPPSPSVPGPVLPESSSELSPPVGAESSPAPQAADTRAAEIPIHNADLSPDEAKNINVRTAENLEILAGGVRKKSEDLRTIKAESDAQFAAAMDEIDALVREAEKGIPKRSASTSSPSEPISGNEAK